MPHEKTSDVDRAHGSDTAGNAEYDAFSDKP
jgi:hypothetical protein